MLLELEWGMELPEYGMEPGQEHFVIIRELEMNQTEPSLPGNYKPSNEKLGQIKFLV